MALKNLGNEVLAKIIKYEQVFSRDGAQGLQRRD
jgi:hypothetical protein